MCATSMKVVLVSDEMKFWEFFFQVPTTVAFAFLAGVDPGVALTGSWIIALIAAIFNGRTGMIYCSAGSVAVVVVDIVKNKGIEYM